MPKSPKWKKRLHYNNGGPTKPSHYYECNGKKVGGPGRSRKNPPRLGWN